ncbi:hypothetical protein BDV36DRAFT_272222, partial [Aspergillus pseudocaelatus]
MQEIAVTCSSISLSRHRRYNWRARSDIRLSYMAVKRCRVEPRGILLLLFTYYSVILLALSTGEDNNIASWLL